MLPFMNKRRDAAGRWREILRRQAGSGLSVVAYCRRVGVSTASFYLWRRKLRNIAADAHATPSWLRGSRSGCTFAEVRVASEGAMGRVGGESTERDAIEVCLAHGRRVIVRPGFDRRTLLDLVSTLERHDANVASPEAGA